VTRRISLTTRKVLSDALRLRYCSAAFSDRFKFLEEFVALTCSHRPQFDAAREDMAARLSKG
jgi:hypothetical protein